MEGIGLRQRIALGGACLFWGWLNFAIPPCALGEPSRWRSSGPEPGRINRILVDPSSPSTIYVRVVAGGLFRTTTGAAPWMPIDDGLEQRADAVSDLVIDPSRTAVLYASVQGGEDAGVYKTLDGGASWQAANAGIASESGLALAIDASASETVYVGTQTGLFRTLDGALSWSHSDVGVRGHAVFALVIDPSSSGVLFAGTDAGVFKTTDGADSWVSASIGLPSGGVTSLAVDLGDSARVYAGIGTAGVYRTFDGGASWSASGLEGLEVFEVVTDQNDPTRLYAATTRGLFQSCDGASTWVLIDTGYASNPVQTVAVDPTNSEVLYAGVVRSGFRGTFLKSGDRGASWTTSDTGLFGSFTGAVAVHPTRPQVALTAGSPRVYRTDDGGVSWTLASDTLPNFVKILRFERANAAGVFAAVGTRVFMSPDLGVTWAERGEGLPDVMINDLQLDPAAPSTIYAATWGEGIYKTTDGGRSWSAASHGLTDPFVSTLAIDPISRTVLYAGASQGVFRSEDAGANWRLLDGSSSGNVSIVVAPDWTHTVYAAAAQSLLRSRDGGATWVSIENGIPRVDDFLALFVRTLAIDPSNPQTLYVGGLPGLYRSTDGGDHWGSFSDGIVLLWPFDIAIGASGYDLYAATYGGLYDYHSAR